MALSGSRALNRDQQPVFDLDHLPQPEPALPTGWQLSVRCDGQPAGPARCASAAEAWLIDPGGQTRRRWPVDWRASPERHPGFIKLAAKPSPKDPTSVELDADGWVTVEVARHLARKGRVGDSIAWWVRAAETASQAGLPGEVARRFHAAAYMAHWSRDFALANRLLIRAKREGRLAGRERALHHYYRALVAFQVGDLRATRAHLEQAEALPVDGETTAALVTVRTDLATTMGRHAEALRLFSASPGPNDALRANNTGWLLAKAMTAGQIPTDYRRVVALFGEAAQTDNLPYRAHALANRAWAWFLAGELAASKADIGAARQLDHESRAYHGLFLDLLDAELALAEGDAAHAEVRFRAVEVQARAEVGGGDAEGAWRARFGQGRAKLARGDAAGALAAYRHALAEVERLGTRAALLADRADFFAGRRALVDATLTLLVAQGDPAGAFEVADGARAHVLRALQARLRLDQLTEAQRRVWTSRAGAFRKARAALSEHTALAGLVAGKSEAEWAAKLKTLRASHDGTFAAAFDLLDEAAPLTVPKGVDGAAVAKWLGPDEAVLALSQVGPRWLAFWVRPAGTRVAWLDGPDPLGPWRGALAGVGHVYVVPGGHPEALRLAPSLYTHASVSFVSYAGLLLAPTRAAGAPLVVADTRSDLPHAVASGRSVAAKLGAKALLGPQASFEAVTAALSGAGLLHFEGHGVLAPDDPWSAHLALANDGRLGLPDVLTRRLQAGLVVLSGCETGTDAVLLRDDVVGLPEAFLAAGAGAVIATDRPVPDAEAAQLMARFYAEGGAERPAHALRVATLALAAEGMNLGGAYRLFGRRVATRDGAAAPATRR